jgi:hypothetical protein
MLDISEEQSIPGYKPLLIGLDANQINKNFKSPPDKTITLFSKINKKRNNLYPLV